MTCFMLVYATKELGLSNSVSLLVNIIGVLVQGVMIVLAANAANRLGSRRITIASAIGLLLWAFPSFYVASLIPPLGLYLAVGVSMIFNGAIVQIAVRTSEGRCRRRMMYSAITMLGSQHKNGTGA